MSDHPTPPSDQPQVLVVGAGPVGLVAAAELARQGVVPRLVEKLATPTTQYRAVGVQPRSQEMLATLGALDRVRARALPQTAIEIDRLRSDGVERLARIPLADLPTRHPMILNLPQTETEAALRERAAELGVVIERGVSLTALTMDDDGVDVVLATPAGEERARVDWVIGADGAHSTVRAAVGSRLQGSFHGTHFAITDASVDSDFARDTTRLFASAGGLTVMLCMQGKRTRLMFQVPDPGPDADAPTLDDLQRLADERMGGGVRISDAEWTGYYTIHHAQVPQYRAGRVFLAGDAAHIHSPAAGQGMNTGMQDTANLAWKLALVCRGLADPGILDSYHAERHPVGAAVVRKATLMADAMTMSGAPAVGRDAIVKTVGHLHPLARAMAENLSELTVAYPDSPIVRTVDRHHAGAAARVGSHAPDVAGLTGTDGAPRWIGDLLTRPGHLLLVRTGDVDRLARLREVLGELGTVVPVVDRADGAPADALVDPDGGLEEHYGLGPDGLALVRPDGYLGYLDRVVGDPEALAGYLSEVLLVPGTAGAGKARSSRSKHHRQASSSGPRGNRRSQSAAAATTTTATTR